MLVYQPVLVTTNKIICELKVCQLCTRWLFTYSSIFLLFPLLNKPLSDLTKPPLIMHMAPWVLTRGVTFPTSARPYSLPHTLLKQVGSKGWHTRLIWVHLSLYIVSQTSMSVTTRLRCLLYWNVPPFLLPVVCFYIFILTIYCTLASPGGGS